MGTVPPPFSAGWEEAFRGAEEQEVLYSRQRLCQGEEVSWEYNPTNCGANQKLGFFFNGQSREEKPTAKLRWARVPWKKKEFWGCFGKLLLLVRALVQISGSC